MVKFRKVEPKDAPRLAEINLPYVTKTAVTFMVQKPTAETFAKKIRDLTPVYPFIVAEIDGKVQGYAYAGAFRPQEAYQWDAELTIYLDENVRCHGLGTALYTRLLHLLTVQGFLNAYAVVALPNDASLEMHKNLGFVQVGLFPSAGYKLGQWRGVTWLCKTLGEYPELPIPPTPMNRFEDHEIAVLLL